MYDTGQWPLRGVAKCQIYCVLGLFFRASPFPGRTDGRTDIFRWHSPRYAYSSLGKNRPILMKFDTLQQILNSITLTWPKAIKFKMADGRHIKNRFFGHNSSTDCPISVKFYMRKQNVMSTKATWQKLQISKSKMADGRHLENKLQ